MKKTRKETTRQKSAAGTKKLNGESDVLAAIAAMPQPDRAIGERLHAIIKASAPALAPKTWYGMPAYARDGKIVCFFRSKQKFKEGYMTFGFNDAAKLDDRAMWPIVFALIDLTAAEEATVAALVKKAVSLGPESEVFDYR